tara:strand:+ start:392 stop:961 length:570 start_codon:yes stop_codon:yes gene_type:complete
MRSLVHKKKDNKHWLAISGIVLVMLMLFSVIGYSFLGNPSNDEGDGGIEYNGTDFYIEDNLLKADVGGLTFIFYQNPNNLRRLNVSLDGAEKYASAPLYFFYKEIDENPASALIYTNMQQIVSKINGGCLEEKDCPEEWPIKTCQDNFILLREKEEISIRQEQNCVFIEGPRAKLPELADDFLLNILGI